MIDRHKNPNVFYIELRWWYIRADWSAES